MKCLMGYGAVPMWARWVTAGEGLDAMMNHEGVWE
jgi:hypothetical protein